MANGGRAYRGWGGRLLSKLDEGEERWEADEEAAVAPTSWSWPLAD
jgi:hypothetical protein